MKQSITTLSPGIAVGPAVAERSVSGSFKVDISRGQRIGRVSGRVSLASCAAAEHIQPDAGTSTRWS